MNDETSFNPFSLSGRRTLITSTSSGLGLVIAWSCAQMGAELIVTGHDQTRLDGCLTTLQLISKLPHRTVQADLRVTEERVAVVVAVDSEIHGLVHSAGISCLCPVRMMTEAHLHEVQSVNIDSPMLLTQALFKRDPVAPDGSALLIASITAHVGVAEMEAYSGTKAALIAMSHCLAMEVVKRNIRVNCLSPSLMEAPLLDVTIQTVGSMGGQRNNHPMSFGKPKDTANAVIFTLSDTSHWVTDTTLVMDDGLTIS